MYGIITMSILFTDPSGTLQALLRLEERIHIELWHFYILPRGRQKAAQPSLP
jgi:hypothetical protein